MNASDLAQSEHHGAALAALLMGAAVNGPGLDANPAETVHAIANVLGDLTKVIAEIRRLQEQRQAIRDRHMPLPGLTGPPMCTECSLHGAHAPWPCGTWKLTEQPVSARPPAAGTDTL